MPQKQFVRPCSSVLGGTASLTGGFPRLQGHFDGFPDQFPAFPSEVKGTKKESLANYSAVLKTCFWGWTQEGNREGKAAYLIDTRVPDQMALSALTLSVERLLSPLPNLRAICVLTYRTVLSFIAVFNGWYGSFWGRATAISRRSFWKTANSKVHSRILISQLFGRRIMSAIQFSPHRVGDTRKQSYVAVL